MLSSAGRAVLLAAWNWGNWYLDLSKQQLLDPSTAPGLPNRASSWHLCLFPSRSCFCRVSTSGSGGLSSVRPWRAILVLATKDSRSFTISTAVKQTIKHRVIAAASSFHKEEMSGCRNVFKAFLCRGPVIPWEEETSPGMNLSKNYGVNMASACSSSSAERTVPFGSTATGTVNPMGSAVYLVQTGQERSFYPPCRWQGKSWCPFCTNLPAQEYNRAQH